MSVSYLFVKVYSLLSVPLFGVGSLLYVHHSHKIFSFFSSPLPPTPPPGTSDSESLCSCFQIGLGSGVESVQALGPK